MAAFRKRSLMYAFGAGILLIAAALIIYAFVLPQDDNKNCEHTGAAYRLNVTDDQFDKTTVIMRRCDTVRVTNQGEQPLELAIGKHSKHLVYPGFTEQTITPGQSLTFTARQAGTYTMHDHLRDTAKTTFVIKD